jgi:phage terminase large subunit GpA-like protein
VLSPEGSAEPGRWDTSRAEYQRGIMDAVSDPLIEEVVVSKSAQVGWTEIIGNIVGYYVDQDPSSMLVLQPTLDMAEAWSKDRLSPMVRDTPCLTAKIADARSRDSGNTVLHKKFAGGQLTIAGANSAASLASRPIRVVLADELDRYPASAGTEGDPLTLAYKRTNNFWNRRKLAGSTPTIAGVSRIEAKFEESDQRRFYVPCPHCGHYQVLRWDQVRWEKSKTGQHRPETAAYVCEECGVLWSDAERWGAVRLGQWRATKPFTGIAGFHIWEAYSPWVKLAETVKAFLEAKKQPETLKVWTNTALGETWTEKGEAPDWQRLYDRRETAISLGTPPEWVGVLTGSVDVQRGGGGRLEFDVWGWGKGLRRVLVAHVDVIGDPADKATWTALDAEIAREWASADGRCLKLSRIAVDSGDGENTMHVYAWARRHPGLVMAIKGRHTTGVGTPVAGPTWVDIKGKGGRTIRKGCRLWTVGTSMLKMELYGFLRLDKPVDGEDVPAGFVHLPGDTGDEWIKQLVAEQLAKKRTRTGAVKLEWQKLRDRNEALDNAIYARAAACEVGIDRWSDARWDAALKPAEPVISVPADAVPNSPAGDGFARREAPQRGRGDWIGPAGEGDWL